jgi:hypothetical protein
MRKINQEYETEMKKIDELRHQCIVDLESLKIGDSLLETARFACKPDHINTTDTASGSHDQYVYEDIGYLYFDNGRLVARQMVGP